MSMSMSAEKNMSLFAALEGRRAIRSYRPERIDRQTVHRLLEAAVQAPTAIHLEPWAFAVVQDPALLARLSDRAKELVRQDAASFRGQGGDGDGAGAHPEGLVALLEEPTYNVFYDASTLILVCARPFGPFASADCWLAAENLMLAAHALGLGSCCIGFAVRVLNLPEVKAELGIPPEVVVVAPIIVGVPRGPIAPKTRKPPLVLSWK